MVIVATNYQTEGQAAECRRRAARHLPPGSAAVSGTARMAPGIPPQPARKSTADEEEPERDEQPGDRRHGDGDAVPAADVVPLEPGDDAIERHRDQQGQDGDEQGAGGLPEEPGDESDAQHREGDRARGLHRDLRWVLARHPPES
ncbi:MAG TPA: hypothetical protein VFL36_12850 [Myxococcales bacterium]|nr:hypothetical protein [Myxococcales bacterium]